MSQETQQTEGQEATPVEVRRKKLPLRILKTMPVEVQQHEIDEAHVANSKKCMVVRSIERDYPTLKNILVEKNVVRVTDPDRNVIYTFDMAPVARAAILKWDAGETVEPFSFKLKHPVIRQRRKRTNAGQIGQMVPVGHGGASRHLGAVPKPKTAASRSMAGRDRVFGAKLWEAELSYLRNLLGAPATA